MSVNSKILGVNTKILLDDSKVIQCNSNVLTLSGDTQIANNGTLKYLTDQSQCAEFTLRSVPDAAYVTGKTSAIMSCISSNYYDKTQINYFTGTTLPANYYNKTQINQYTGSTNNRINTIETKYISGATNGLTKVGKQVKLGGTLTGSTIITDGRGTPVGIQYGGDYSANYTARSLVDAAYVTGKTTTSGVQTANNGLTKNGTNVRLGGALTGDTTISAGSHDSCLLITAPMCACDMHVIGFHVDSTPTYKEGQLYYNNCQLNFMRETSGVTLQIGEETVLRVTQTTGAPIPNGSIVYISGAANGLTKISKAIASDCSQAVNVIGVTTQEIPDNGEGYVTLNGLIHDIDTSSWAAGTRVYLSPTQAGCMTTTKPVYPNQPVRVGYVTCQDSSNGSVLIDVVWEPEHVDNYVFTGYTASTQSQLNTKLSCSTFNTYTGNTATCIAYLDSVADKVLTGATNGLTATSRVACLGGALTMNTQICGANCLKLGDLDHICLSTQNTTDIALNAKSNGAIYLKSQSGTVASSNDTTNAVLIAIDYNASPAMLITDSTASPRGLVYAGDYSSTYCQHSLVDKYYVDSVATGLNVHGAVTIATVSGVTLSGLSQTIDGVSLTTGMRILVKDQSNQTTNGIYSASTGVWGRTADYNFEPSGEVTNGDLIPVLSGTTNANSQWILVSPNPIISGTTNLIFSKFSQQQGIVQGDGICVTTVGANRQVDVKLSQSTPGLCFDNTSLELDYNIFRYGLTCSQTSGKVDVKTAYCAATGSEIPVALNTGNTSCKLYVDSCTIKTCLNPVINANNGLTKAGCTVSLGGVLTGDTTINGNSGAYDLNISNLDSFNIGFDNVSTITDSGTNGGLRYAADYSGNYVTRSLVDKGYVDGQITNGVIACNGLTKVGNKIILGGTLTGNTFISYGTNRLCFIDGGTSCIDMISDCTKVHVQNTSMCLQACTNSTCNASVCLNNSGELKLSTNATTPICVTAPQAMQYAADYSSTFVDRSLVDKAYVDNAVVSGTSLIQASNGLTRVNNTIALGGTLTGDTSICLNSSNFNFGCSTEPTYLGINSVGEYINAQASVNTYFNLCGSGGSANADLSVGGNSGLNISDSACTARLYSNVTCVDMSGLSGFEYIDLCANVNTYLQLDATSGTESTILQGNTNTFLNLCGVSGSETVNLQSNNYQYVELSSVNSNEYAWINANTTTYLNLGGVSGSENYELKAASAHICAQGWSGNESICINPNTLTNATIVTINGVSGNEFVNIQPNPGTQFVINGVSGSEYSAIKAGNVCLCMNTTGCNVFFDDTALKGLEYAADYSANFTERSLVDAAYVTGKTTTSGVQTANNGLNKVGTNVRLGGVLTGNTWVCIPADTCLAFGDATTVNTNIQIIRTSGSESINMYTNGTTFWSDLYLLDGNSALRYYDCNAATTSTLAVECNRAKMVAGGGNSEIDADINFILLGYYGTSSDEVCLSSAGISVLSNTAINLGSASCTGQVFICAPITAGSTSDQVIVRDSSTGELKTVAGSSLGDKNNIYATTVITTSTGLTTGSTYVQIVNSPSASTTVTLPATPIDGQVFRIKDAGNNAVNFPITIARNGKLIDNAANNATLNTDGGALELVYNNSLGSWFVFSFVN